MNKMDNITESSERFIDRHYRLIAWLVVIGLLLLGGVSLLWPQYQRLQSSGVLQHSAAQERLSLNQGYLADLQTMEMNYEDLDTRSLRLLDTIVPVQQPGTRLYEEFELVFANSDLELQTITISVPELTTDEELAELAEGNTIDMVETDQSTIATGLDDIVIATITLNVTAEDGSYEEFKRVLQFIEQYEHVLDLDTVTYGSSAGAYTFVLTTYQRKVPTNNLVE